MAVLWNLALCLLFAAPGSTETAGAAAAGTEVSLPCSAEGQCSDSAGQGRGGGGDAAPVAKENLLLQQAVFRRLQKANSTGEGEEIAEVAVSAETSQHEWCDPTKMSRRRRHDTMCSCRRRSASRGVEDRGTGWHCVGDTIVPNVEEEKECQSCVCLFDVDRTLTGKQGDVQQCPRNRVLDVYDRAYGGGTATLSALANEGINTTFCNGCYLGITSAGHGSGFLSKWNKYILKIIMRSEKQDAFIAANPQFLRWSYGTSVKSPYVLGQPDTMKQESVELIRQWYGQNGVCIAPQNVFFFGDRTENIAPFKQKGLNSREISCGSRDRELYHASGMVGYCGATPEEIRRERGNILCR